MVRISARQLDPAARSRLETVPEPMMVPAASGRVLRRVGDQAREVEIHIHTGVGVPGRMSRSFKCTISGRPSLPPSQAAPSSFRRHRDGCEGRARLADHEAEALGQLRRDQPAQRHVVDQHHQLDVAAGGVGADPHRHIVDDHSDFGLEVDAAVLAGDQDVLARRRESRSLTA